jgi:hypothetical protein
LRHNGLHSFCPPVSTKHSLLSPNFHLKLYVQFAPNPWPCHFHPETLKPRHLRPLMKLVTYFCLHSRANYLFRMDTVYFLNIVSFPCLSRFPLPTFQLSSVSVKMLDFPLFLSLFFLLHL